MFYVYILKCVDGLYYTGHTDNLDTRMNQHSSGQIGFTATKRPLQLIWNAEFETRYEALVFEQQIKGWSRAKKEALMNNDWQTIQRLASSKRASTSSARTAQ